MHKIIISHEKPPIYEKLRDKFGVDWDSGLIVAYDQKIHTKNDILPQKVIHEKKHLDEQSRIGNDVWWSMYLTNDVFRLEQEVMAHKAEADFIKRNIKDRELRFYLIREIAGWLASSMYGNMLTSDEALRILR